MHSSCERLNRSSLFVAALSTRWPWVARGCHGNKCSLSLIRAVVFFELEIRLGPPTGLHTWLRSGVRWFSHIVYHPVHNLQLSTGFTGCLSDVLDRNPRLGVMSFGDNTEHKLKYPLLSDPNNLVCEHCGAMLWIEETINCCSNGDYTVENVPPLPHPKCKN